MSDQSVELKEITQDNKLKTDQVTKYKEAYRDYKAKSEELDGMVSQLKNLLVTSDKQLDATKKQLE